MWWREATCLMVDRKQKRGPGTGYIGAKNMPLVTYSLKFSEFPKRTPIAVNQTLTVRAFQQRWKHTSYPTHYNCFLFPSN